MMRRMAIILAGLVGGVGVAVTSVMLWAIIARGVILIVRTIIRQ